MVALVLLLGVLGCAGVLGVVGMAKGIWLAAFSAIAAVIAVIGFRIAILKPNEAGVITFFGTYVGSIKTPGFHLYVPFGRLLRMTLKLLNFEIGPVKVNDADGNPILIGAIAVVRVTDTFKAAFNVEDWMSFAETQAETTVRALAAAYPYDSGADGTPSLLHHHEQIREVLMADLRQRLEPAGLDVIDARLSHLAYAPEIASAMLRRQQAKATVMARQQIAEGAAAIVEDTLKRLQATGSVKFEERDLSRVAANLMVVLTSEQAVNPMIDVSG